MKTGILYLRSKNVAGNELENQNHKILEDIAAKAGTCLPVINKDEALQCDSLFVFVSGGGTENTFKETLDSYNKPIYLLATNSNNSLAASMEILSYLKNSRPSRFSEIAFTQKVS